MSEDERRDVIATDFDGTLALYEGWQGPDHFPPPVPAMVERVKQWIEDGKEVWILTARLSHPEANRKAVKEFIQNWCEVNGLPRLEVTDRKMWFFKEMWDDRAVQVVENTGHPVDGRDHHG